MQEIAMAEKYDPNQLIDALVARLKLKNDAELCKELEVAPPVISKLRHRRFPIGPLMLIRMHEVSGLNIKDLKALMGDRRSKIRPNTKENRTINHQFGNSRIRHAQLSAQAIA